MHRAQGILCTIRPDREVGRDRRLINAAYIGNDCWTDSTVWNIHAGYFDDVETVWSYQICE